MICPKNSGNNNNRCLSLMVRRYGYHVPGLIAMSVDKCLRNFKWRIVYMYRCKILEAAQRGTAVFQYLRTNVLYYRFNKNITSICYDMPSICIDGEQFLKVVYPSQRPLKITPNKIIITVILSVDHRHHNLNQTTIKHFKWIRSWC